MRAIGAFFYYANLFQKLNKEIQNTAGQMMSFITARVCVFNYQNKLVSNGYIKS
jgi:hypothetical protein